MAKLHISPSECIGCNNCELACSFRFSGGSIPLAGKAITVYSDNDKYIPATCFQCEEAACVKVCPANALVRNEKTMAIKVDHHRCIGCGQCAQVCPFGHISMNSNTSIAIKCDLCYGNPTCAMFCPTEALAYY